MHEYFLVFALTTFIKELCNIDIISQIISHADCYFILFNSHFFSSALDLLLCSWIRCFIYFLKPAINARADFVF